MDLVVLGICFSCCWVYGSLAVFVCIHFIGSLCHGVCISHCDSLIYVVHFCILFVFETMMLSLIGSLAGGVCIGRVGSLRYHVCIDISGFVFNALTHFNRM